MDGLPVNFALNVTVISSEEIPAGVKTDRFINGKANVTVSGNTYMLSDISDANINVETIIGGNVAGKGKPFQIFIYGSQKLKPMYP